MDPAPLRTQPDLGAAAPSADAGGASDHDWRQCLPAHDCAKGFFPQQDTGRLAGGIQGAQDSSFNAMKQRMTRFVDIVKADPAVARRGLHRQRRRDDDKHREDVYFIEASRRAQGQRRPVIGRLRRQLATVEGASLFLQSTQDLRVGGRAG